MLEVGGLPGVDAPGARLPTGPTNATVRPVLTESTTWEKVRALPIAGQVAIWATLGFILLLIAAGLVTLLSKDSSERVTSGTGLVDLTVGSTAVSTTTTSTIFVPSSIVPATIIVPTIVAVETSTTEAPTTTEVPTTLESTTVPPTEAPTTIAPTTVAPTTVAPTTIAPTTVPHTVPVTVAPTTSPTAAPTTVAPTTTTTIAADPNNSFCHDAHNDGAGNFDLLDASIHRIADAGQYVLVATAVGPTTGQDIAYTFSLGHGDVGSKPDAAYLVVGTTHADKTVTATITDVRSATTTNLTGAVVSPTKVTLTVTDDQISSVAGSAFDWTITLGANGTDVDNCVVTGFGTTK